MNVDMRKIGLTVSVLALVACTGTNTSETTPIDSNEVTESEDVVVDDTVTEDEDDTVEDDADDTDETDPVDDIDDDLEPLPISLTCGPFESYSTTEFSCLPVGEIRPVLNEPPRSGALFTNVWYPNMRFPLQNGPAYLNSQVHGYKDPEEYNTNQLARSGLPMGLPDNGYHQCDSRNYSFPWEDNFCEKRSDRTRICPSGSGHRGVDIRSANCGAMPNAPAAIKVVSASDGYIIEIHTHYTKAISTDGEMRFYYMHMEPGSRTFDEMDLFAAPNGRIQISRGQILGDVGRQAYSGPTTTYHLHFEMETVVARQSDGVPYGYTHLPPYMTLVDSYERLLNGTP